MAHDRRRACIISALICLAIGFAWQALTVHYNRDGNWSALFLTGSRFPVPPALASENLYVFPDSAGYDGQMYHYVAHDPLLRNGLGKYIDSAQLRYRRILLPASAFLLAGGRQGAIDACFIASNLLFLFLGAWWLSRYFVLSGLSPLWSILFVTTPAAVTSLDRLTVDLSLTALAMGFAYYAQIEARWRLYAVLMLAGLSRETGLILIAAYCISRLAQRRFLQAVLYSTAVLPTALWYLYVDSRTEKIVGAWFRPPLFGIVNWAIHPFQYQYSLVVNAVITSLDYLSMAGIVMACALALVMLFRNPFGHLEIASALWAAMAVCFNEFFWQDALGGGRVLSALLVFLILRNASRLSIVWCLPLIFVSMRIWLQLLSPFLGIVKGVLHHGR
jgi:hypothetical protein